MDTIKQLIEINEKLTEYLLCISFYRLTKKNIEEICKKIND